MKIWSLARKMPAALNKYGLEMLGGLLMFLGTAFSTISGYKEHLAWAYLLLFAEGALITAYGIERRYNYRNHILAVFFVVLGICALLPGLLLIAQCSF